MKGNALYLVGTLVQLVAFSLGVAVPVIGVALTFYGVGMIVAYYGGYIR